MKKKIIVENVRGQWVVDKTTTDVFLGKTTGYSDGALIELEIGNCEDLCCHPDETRVCPHK